MILFRRRDEDSDSLSYSESSEAINEDDDLEAESHSFGPKTLPCSNDSDEPESLDDSDSGWPKPVWEISHLDFLLNSLAITGHPKGRSFFLL